MGSSISKEEKIAYGVLAVVILILVVLVTTIVILKSKDDEQFIPSGSNGAVNEIFSDPSIPAGSETLNLIKAGAGNGPKWCISTFYSYRLVNRKTGGYGVLAPWSQFPVIADPSVVSPNPNIDAEAGCNMVLPSVGFQSKIDLTTDIVYNVHRQTTSLDLTGSGVIVGRLVSSSTSWIDGNVTVHYYTAFTDANNPNTISGACGGCL